MTPDQYQDFVRRFIETCQVDRRVVAAFLGGSYAAGTADAHADLDLYLITPDEACDSFFAERQEFMRRLGEPLFLEDFNAFGFDMLNFIYAEGIEGEVALARQSHFTHIHGGPFTALVDKQGILAGAVFPLYRPTLAEQQANLHQLIYWFWRDILVYMKAMGRQQLWYAYGALEEARVKCVNLLRLSVDFTAGAVGYGKLEQAVAEDRLQPLRVTFCPLERAALFEAAAKLIQCHQEIAGPLAAAHGVTYPADLARFISARFELLRQMPADGANTSEESHI